MSKKGDNETIGQRLREGRKKKRLTQQDVADKFNLHTRTIYNYEHGRVRIPKYRLNQLCELYGLSSSDYNIGDEGLSTSDCSTEDMTHAPETTDVLKERMRMVSHLLFKYVKFLKSPLITQQTKKEMLFNLTRLYFRYMGTDL